MRKFAFVCAAGCTLLALQLLLGTDASGAPIDKDVKEALDKIAGLIEKGDDAAAKKEAAALGKKIEELNDVMHAFKPRVPAKKKGIAGIGVGSKPGVVTPDGIEQKLVDIGRNGIAVNDLKREGKAIGEAAWHIAAIAEVALAKPTDKVNTAAKKEMWKKWSEDMRAGAKDLAAAVKTNSAAEVKTAVTKLNTSCNACHAEFRK